MSKATSVNLSIGVKNYELIAMNACGFDKTCPSRLQFSFKLEGDFCEAALTDCLEHTVDYDTLSQELAALLSASGACDNNKIKNLIRDFSIRIHAGCVELELNCSHTYLKDQFLL